MHGADGLGEDVSTSRTGVVEACQYDLLQAVFWAPALIDEVAATGAVDTLDFKGQHGVGVGSAGAGCAVRPCSPRSRTDRICPRTRRSK